MWLIQIHQESSNVSTTSQKRKERFQYFQQKNSILVSPSLCLSLCLSVCLQVSISLMWSWCSLTVFSITLVTLTRRRPVSACSSSFTWSSADSAYQSATRLRPPNAPDTEPSTPLWPLRHPLCWSIQGWDVAWAVSLLMDWLCSAPSWPLTPVNPSSRGQKSFSEAPLILQTNKKLMMKADKVTQIMELWLKLTWDRRLLSLITWSAASSMSSSSYRKIWSRFVLPPADSYLPCLWADGGHVADIPVESRQFLSIQRSKNHWRSFRFALTVKQNQTSRLCLLRDKSSNSAAGAEHCYGNKAKYHCGSLCCLNFS